MVCVCCAPCEYYYLDGETQVYSPEYRTYSYGDTVPPAPDFCDCPCQAGHCVEPNVWGATSGCYDPDNLCVDSSLACCEEELSCYVRSSDFSATATCKPRVTIFDGSTLDDWGTISGATQTIDVADRCLESPYADGPVGLPPTGGRVSGNQTIEPIVVDNGDGTKYLKLNIVAKNGIACGPYGVSSLSVVWFFE